MPSNNIHFYPENWASNWQNMSLEAKATFGATLEELSKKNADALKQGMAIGVMFNPDGSIEIVAGSYQAGSYTEPTFKFNSPEGEVKAGSKNELNDIPTNYKDNAKADIEMGAEAKGGFQLFGASGSSVYIAPSGWSFTTTAAVDLLSLSAKIEASVGVKQGPEASASVSATLAKLGVTGSYHHKPNITLDGNLNMVVSQREIGMNISFGLSGKAEVGTDGTKISATKGIGIGDFNIWSKEDITGNALHYFDDMNQFEVKRNDLILKMHGELRLKLGDIQKGIEDLNKKIAAKQKFLKGTSPAWQALNPKFMGELQKLIELKNKLVAQLNLFNRLQKEVSSITAAAIVRNRIAQKAAEESALKPATEQTTCSVDELTNMGGKFTCRQH